MISTKQRGIRGCARGRAVEAGACRVFPENGLYARQKAVFPAIRGLRSQLVSAQEMERRRLARELHDGVANMLSGVKFKLAALSAKNTPDGKTAERGILEAVEGLDRAITEIRRVSKSLIPSELEALGLEPAIHMLCRELRERAGIPVTLQTEKSPPDVAAGPALAVFRIAQEAMNNISKHSRATRVVVNLSRKGGDVVLNLSDNGVGFEPGKVRPRADGGIGLGSMRERTELAGGSLELYSRPGAGTTLNVRVPLSEHKGHLQ